MELSRRRLLRDAGAVTLGFIGVKALLADPAFAQSPPPAGSGYGPLIRDPKRIIDLPAGFSYQAFSRTGETMADGLRVPGRHDGMWAFPGPEGQTILVRNHELAQGDTGSGPWAGRQDLLATIPTEKFYDPGSGTRPVPMSGGTTTLVYDTKQQKLISHFLSLAGTIRNCAGGPTPWGSWVTCEETVDRAGSSRSVDHGYNFEVPATATPGLAAPTPLKAMGRFNHEAIAVDVKSGIVYETEDRDNGLIYRFIPEVPGQLAAGGKLQALKIKERSKALTQNWSTANRIPPGVSMEVEWIDMTNVEAPSDDLRVRGFNAGAAQFARGEGMWSGLEGIYFACTSGGPSRLGQIGRYIPSPSEGKPEEAQAPGRLELFVESNSSALMAHADNLTMAPWGDLILAEDSTSGAVNHLVGVTPLGVYYRLGRNAMNTSEFAGVTFSPDGSTLFANIYSPGLTLAITGPWHANRGDMNRDGKIDFTDVRDALEMSVGLRPSTAAHLQEGDFDQNGRIDVYDAVQIIRNVFGFRSGS
ncbi:MAG: DUF839 domain-containing protein [Armatimonadetes bacterium]|nr:DUF839 domain-containing protein [Armatimonadota bacterium]